MLKLIAPVFITLMTASLTYPVAVRLVKYRPLRLRGYWAIHLTIAPFLALINVNVFGATHSYFRIKVMEQDFIALIQETGGKIRTDYEYDGYNQIK
jgi:hypothetical protein